MTMRCIAAFACVVLAGLVPAGCATATIEDAVPAGALEQASSTEAPAAPQGAGTYPNLNVPPTAAAPQISAEQKAAETAELRARRAQLAQEAGKAGVSDDAEALRRRASTHAEETLKEIEGD